jgi:manganese/iron transport system ATP-binding protein/manganese/zinc/iron transport system ATP- binding protein
VLRAVIAASVRGLAAGYNGKPVLSGVTFDAVRGERLAVLGPNGGGKTTLFRVLQGQLRPLAGTVTVAGRAGTVPQTDRSRLDFPVDALDVVLMGTLAARPWWRPAGRHERAAAREALATVGLADRAHTSFGALSGGQRQRVLIARALVQRADVLLLDEPFSGLDSTSARRLEALLEDLAAAGHALLIATHDLLQARTYDRVLCLNGEQVAVGTPDEVLSTEVLARTYGADLVRLPDGGQLAVLPAHHHHDDAGHVH